MNEDNETKITSTAISDRAFEEENTIKIKHASKMPKIYTDLECMEVRKSDILKISDECKKCSKSNGLISEILITISFGLSSAFFGFAISGLLAHYQSDEWQFWICYLVCPLLCMLFLCVYILLMFIRKNKKDKLLEVVIEKLLVPAECWEGENKND